ncbi:MAG: ankyrin repeat domain-containing protein [Bacteroidetes bacterium]|nr:ankyrin repeat domain-containing protein [Bacteroidota bacterium]
MKKYISLLFAVLLYGSLFAQYKIAYEKAIEFENKEKYYDAIQMFNTANTAWDKPADNDLANRIYTCTEKLNSTLNKAKSDEKEAKDLNVKNIQKISDIFKIQGDLACSDYNWGDALLYYKQAYDKYPENANIEANAKKALAGFIPEITVFKRSNLINDILFNPSGKYLVTASGKTIQVFNMETFSDEYILRGHTGEVTALAFSSDPDILMSYSKDGSIRFWDLKNGIEIGKWRHYLYEDDVLNEIAFDIDLNFYIMAYRKNLFIYSLDKNKKLVVIQGHKNDISSFSYSSKKHIIVSASAKEEDGSVRINDISDIDKEEVRFIRAFASKVKDVEIDEGGRYLVYTANIGLGSIGVYDITNNVVTNIISDPGIVEKIALNSEKNLLSYIYHNIDNKCYPMYLYDLSNLADQKKRAKMNSHETRAVIRSTFSYDGSILASADDKGDVRIWSIEPKYGDNYKINLENACKLGSVFKMDSLGFSEMNEDSLLYERKLNTHVNWLPKAIKNQSEVDIENDPLLMRHIRYGRWDMAKKLISETPGCKNIRNAKGYSPLMYAIIQNNSDLINSLKNRSFSEDFLFLLSLNDTKYFNRYLNNGVDVNYANSYGETALHMAAKIGNLEIVKVLVEKYGANLNACTVRNETPLMYALKSQSEDVASYLLSKDPILGKQEEVWGWTEILAAAYRGYTSIVEELIERKVNLNEQDYTGSSAIFTAAENGNNEILNLLLEANAKQEIANFIYGRTPLIIACIEGNFEGCRLLLESNANVNACDSFGTSPLMFAAINDYIDIVRLLVTNGANINHKDRYEMTASDYALEFKNIQISKFLIEHKAKDQNQFMFREKLELRGKAVNYAGFSEDGCDMSIIKIDSVNYYCEVKYDGNKLVGQFKSVKGTENTSFGNNRMFQFEGYEYSGKTGEHSTFEPGSNAKCTIQIALTPAGVVKGVYHLGIVGNQSGDQYGTFDLKLVRSK